MPSDIAFSSAAALAAKLRSGKLSALELLDHYIARVEKYDPMLNAVVVRDFDRARARANPGKLNIANVGTSTIGYLLTLQLGVQPQ